MTDQEIQAAAEKYVKETSDCFLKEGFIAGANLLKAELENEKDCHSNWKKMSINQQGLLAEKEKRIEDIFNRLVKCDELVREMLPYLTSVQRSHAAKILTALQAAEPKGEEK
jgi:hypothetical protein